MANYICQTITPRISSRFIGKISVPVGGLNPGNVVVADTLDNSLVGNYEVFTATKPSSSNLDSKAFAIVMNDGFEEINDGRRPSGNPNYYQYTFKAGDTAPILFLENHLMFNIGLDTINQNTLESAIVGNYLIPVANSNTLSAVGSIPSNVSTALKILSLYDTPVGGNFAGSFARSLVCVAVNFNDIDSGVFITSFSIPNQVGDTVINQENGTIDINYIGDKTALVASFTNSRDSKVYVGSTVQVSGTTSNNFTNAVSYVVKAENGKTKTYTVTVTTVTEDAE